MSVWWSWWFSLGWLSWENGAGRRGRRRIGRPTHSARDEVVLDGEQGGRGTCRHADLGVDVLGVVLGGAAGDEQARRHLGVAAPRGDQRQDLDLAFAQARRPWPRAVVRRGCRPRPARPRRRRGRAGPASASATSMPAASLGRPARPGTGESGSWPRRRRPRRGGGPPSGCRLPGSRGGTRTRRAARGACQRRVAIGASDGEVARIRSE